MSKDQAKKQLEKLREFIRKWNDDYFIHNKTEVSEAARDKIKRELEELEEQYPDLISPDSPTQRVGAPISGRLPKVLHKTKKESLQDVFSLEELEEWKERAQKILPNESFEYVSELKIDGLNVTLWYENGFLTKALTRGDGIFGEDVTHAVKAIECIPLKLQEEIDAEISGEVYMSHTAFQALKGSEDFANTRNAAAGTLRQLDPAVVEQRKLSAFFYTLKTDSRPDQDRLLEKLRELGLPVEAHWEKHHDFTSLEKFMKAWEKKKESLDYVIDGVVVKINRHDHQERLGSTARAPRWAVAYKFPAEQSSSIVEDIVLQVGRTGAITPVAELKPTFLAGSTISRATLHNKDEIERKDIRIGDHVVIQKAGDVIPEVVQVLVELRTGSEKIFHFPSECPVCETSLEKPEGEAIHRCPSPDCPGKTRENLYHFVSKKCFDIDALGPKIIDQLIDKGLIVTAADIFHLNYEDLIHLDLFEKRRTENLLEALEKAKDIPFSRFFFSLGMRHVGEKTAYDLSPELQRHVTFKTGTKKMLGTDQRMLFGEHESGGEEIEYISPMALGKLMKEEEGLYEKLQTVEGMGPKALESLRDWFRSEEHQYLLEKLSASGIRLLKEEYLTEEDPDFTGKTFVITGSFEAFSREELKQIVLRKGGKVSSSISSKTDVLMFGENPGSKLKKAQELGVEIWDEEKVRKEIK